MAVYPPHITHSFRCHGQAVIIVMSAPPSLQWESGTEVGLLLVTHLKNNNYPVTDELIGLSVSLSVCLSVCLGEVWER